MSEFLDRLQSLTPERLVLLARELQARLTASENAAHEPIAIVGMAGRYPGANDGLGAFWSLLREGRIAVGEWPPARCIDAPPTTYPVMKSRADAGHGAYLADIDRFDAEFFRISSKEAQTLDPQHRLLLETAWRALEDAARAPARSSALHAGVFIGICTNDYAELLRDSRTEWPGYFARGNSHAIAAGRLSYALGLEGPSLSIDTACSSSLAAIHTACQSLRNRECDLTLAGGVNVILSPVVGIDLRAAGLISPTGSCRPFDARADGYVRGEGCGVLVLRRLSDALSDGDRIIAVIRGSAISHDGQGGLLTPSSAGQRAVMHAALNSAVVDPADVAYLESSSVGTLLGDPLELKAAGEVLGRKRSHSASVLVSSLKSNIGHLEGAAGVAAVSKVALALQCGLVPPHPGFAEPNPHVPWQDLRVEVPREAIALEGHIAAVNAFSLSGANVHMLLERAPARRPRSSPGARPVLALSAASPDALNSLVDAYRARLQGADPAETADVCYSAAIGRRTEAYRHSIAAADREALCASLRRLAANEVPEAAPVASAPAAVGIFLGHSTPILRSDIPLGQLPAEFGAAWRRFHEASSASVGIAPTSPFPTVVPRASAATNLHAAGLQYALGAMWCSLGVRPRLLFGVGRGEVVAACLAGLFTLEDAIAMLVDRRPPTAFAREKFALVSGRTGRRVARGELAQPEYWRDRREAHPIVATGLETLRAEGVQLLLSATADPLPAAADPTPVPMLDQGGDIAASTAVALAAMFRFGARLDWTAVYRDQPVQRTSAPGRIVQRRRFWLLPPSASIESHAPPPAPAWSDELAASVDTCATHRDGSAGVSHTQEEAHAEMARAALPYMPAGERLRQVEGLVRRELGDLLEVEADVLAMDASLTDLGLDSLMAMQLADRLRFPLRAELPLAHLAHVHTLGQLCAVLTEQALSTRTEERDEIEPDLAARYEPFELTDVQQAYWFGRLHAFALGGVATHLYFEYEVPELDVDRLQAALRGLVQRHDMLRAVILPTGQQKILESVPDYEIIVEDLSKLAPSALEAALAHTREQHSHEVLASDRWPLFDLRASRLPSDAYRLHASIDMLIADAWSIQIVIRELALRYAQPDATLPELTLSFRDCVLASNASESSEPFRRSARYWRERLDKLQPPALPLALRPDEVARPRFERRSATIDVAAWQQLQQRATMLHVTPTTLLLTAFALVLRTWSTSDRFALNLTLFNRPPVHPEINEVVGDFTSLILLEVDLSEHRSVAGHAELLQAQLWRDLDHRHFSGVRVLRELSQRGGRTTEAMMPVVFTSGLGFGSIGTLGIAPGKLRFAVSQTPQVWLDHQLFEHDGELVLIWDAVEALFPPHLLDDMFAAYIALIKDLASGRQPLESAQPPLLPNAQAQRRRAVNATALDLPALLLHEPFFEHAKRSPDSAAVFQGDVTLSYGDLAQRAIAVANRLLAAGVRPNELVAVALEKGWYQAVAVLGVLESGAAYLPVDPAVPTERLHYLLAHAKVRVVLTQTTVDQRLNWPACVTLRITDFDEPTNGSGVAPQRRASRGDLAYVIYTSGSTGLPKGVEITHGAAANTVLDVNRRFELGPTDRILALSSLSFDLSVFDIFGALSCGGGIVFPDAERRRDPHHWRELLQDAGVTVWNSVPALMRLLVEAVASCGETLAPSLRLVMLSGDWIPVDLPKRIRASSEAPNPPQVVSLGGATEAAIWSVFHPVDDVSPEWKSIPYGRPLANQTLHVLDEHFEPRPDWVAGDLFIAGDGLARGYWKDAQRSDAAFVRHPRTGQRLYRTGDLARYRSNGDLEFLGRLDRQVKVNGYRIELGEVEAHLQSHPQVRQAACVATGKRDGERRLLAAFVPVTDASPTPDALREHLAQRLPPWLLPSGFVAMPAIPLSANGKVDPAAVLQSEAQPLPPTPAAGNNPLVVRLLARIRDELDLEVLSPNDSLLSVGASSLDLLRIVDEVEAILGFRPRVEAFFQQPTVAGLAELHQRWQAGEPIAQTEDTETTDVLDQRFASAGRDAIKHAKPRSRRFAGDRPRIALPMPDEDDVERATFAARRTHREFDTDPLPLAALARTLAPLRSVDVDGESRRLYASANSMYPVQVYLWIKPRRVQHLDGGTYYFDPEAHELRILSAVDSMPEDIHLPYNQSIADGSAFAIFLVAAMEGIRALYGDLGEHLVAIEAGLMSQLLDLSGPANGVALCHIGRVAPQALQPAFELEDEHRLVHTLLGGAIVGTPMLSAQAASLEHASARDTGIV